MRRRGGVYHAKLPGVAERKIVLVVSWHAANAGQRPIVVRVTSKWRPREIPTYVELDPGEGGLREQSWVLCHEMTMLLEEAIDKEPLGTLSFGRMLEVNAALKRTLDIP